LSHLDRRFDRLEEVSGFCPTGAASSIAVPWSTEVRIMGRPSVTLIPGRSSRT